MSPLQREIYVLLFRQNKRGQRVLPVSAISQLPSAQNNPYAKVAEFGVAYSNALQWQVSIL